MPISSSLAARLRTSHSPAPAPSPARRSPYARPSVPEPRGGAKSSRPPLHLDPATARLLGPSQKAVRPGLDRRADPDAPDARAPESKPKRAAGDNRPPLELKEKRRCSGVGGRRAAPDARAPESKPKLAAGDDRPRLEQKRRCSGEGGFVFVCALAGHTEAISGISLPLGSDKLYTGSVDGSVRIWDCNSGKVDWFSVPDNVSDYARAPNNL